VKQYVQKREPVRAVQWLGEKTPELIELLGEHGDFSTSTSKSLELRLGRAHNNQDRGGYVLPGYWICSSSGEDFTVLSDMQFRDRYEEVGSEGREPPTPTEHEEDAQDFLKKLDALIFESLHVSMIQGSPEHKKIFHDRNVLTQHLRELLGHAAWLAARRESTRLRELLLKTLG
jgi:hypothetical protein